MPLVGGCTLCKYKRRFEQNPYLKMFQYFSIIKCGGMKNSFLCNGTINIVLFINTAIVVSSEYS